MTPGVVSIAVALGAMTVTAAQPAPPYRLVRHGPERLQAPYNDPQRATKEVLIARINRDRSLHGVPPLQHDPRLSLAGDRFCLDQAMTGVRGHWDVEGRAPYVRWGLAGGLDYHVQNTGSYSSSAGQLDETAEAIALQLHMSMMDEKPPDDGHRRTILDPLLTHVGIGLSQAGGELRLAQEFSRVALDWIELPDRPVPRRTVVEFAGKPLAGYEVGLVEIAYEPLPRKLGARDAHRSSYGYPEALLALRPKLPQGWFYAGGRTGDFDVGPGGEFRLQFPCNRGPGYYFVLCYVRRTGDREGEMRPATAAMITAK